MQMGPSRMRPRPFFIADPSARCGIDPRAALYVCEVFSISVRRFILPFCCIASRANSHANHRPAIEQAADRRGSGRAAARQWFTDFDGDFARRPIRGHGGCRLRNLRVAVQPVALGPRYAHRCARRFPRPAHRAAEQANALLRPRFQPRWQPHLRQHGFDVRPQR